MKHALFLMIGIALSCHITAGAAISEAAKQNTYSVLKPIAPIYDEAEVVVHTARFNNWLNANIDKITEDSLPKVREHLYYLIDSHVKNTSLGGSPALPEEADLVLATLFSWSERLRVYGGSIVYEAIRPETMKSIPSVMKVPEHFQLSLHDGLYELASINGGWRARIPYYFMIGRIQEFEAANGQLTQLAIISTGAASHINVEGYSQATLMLVSSSAEDASEFPMFWAQQFGIDENATEKTLEGTELRSRYSIDEAASIHKEFVSWPTESGTIGVAYLGVNGTYQHNRPHFLEFLATFQTN